MGRLYIERWLTAPMQRANGEIVQRNKGTLQGGVISPVFANLFLHYVFDKIKWQMAGWENNYLLKLLQIF
ncbi:hypothetical protein LCGC14_1046490 [marine sediment metagenome]|uniref:Reverse transcriptase domain-containing protein n=1 Tax=marine sediment metagenome TaxID=412755 RepID=A0A0F9MQ79_9ZZZZ